MTLFSLHVLFNVHNFGPKINVCDINGGFVTFLNSCFQSIWYTRWNYESQRPQNSISNNPFLFWSPMWHFYKSYISFLSPMWHFWPMIQSSVYRLHFARLKRAFLYFICTKFLVLGTNKTQLIQYENIYKFLPPIAKNRKHSVICKVQIHLVQMIKVSQDMIVWKPGKVQSYKIEDLCLMLNCTSPCTNPLSQLH